MTTSGLGEPLPPDTTHAVSVSLPTWEANIGYEEGSDWVISRLKTGYPRFFIHKSVHALAQEVISKYGQPNQSAMLFSTKMAARRCLQFISQRPSFSSSAEKFKVLDLVLNASKEISPVLKQLSPCFSVAFFSPEAFPVAKEYWQHTGDGISSRLAEFCLELHNLGFLIPFVDQTTTHDSETKLHRGPKRYLRPSSLGDASGIRDSSTTIKPQLILRDTDDSAESLAFLEERFGRNLDLSFVQRAKSAMRRRIAGSLKHDVDVASELPPPYQINPNARGINSLTEDDVYLFPTGMTAIYTAHRALLAALGSFQSISFGFPYVDTLKILQKFGPGCVFYGHATSADLEDLENQLMAGKQFLALFCEFPGNPLLTCPDLIRIRQLADEFGFAVVVDETIGTFANVNVLPMADIVVSSLTKIFSGDANVMGGSAILNPQSQHYALLKNTLDSGIYEDNYWAEDIVFMERNSRDFASRVKRINTNAEAICEILQQHSIIKTIFYPKLCQSKANYEACRLTNGGYGGLISIIFAHPQHAITFHDTIKTAKGPSLGTNFTLCSPYTLLAHYQELPWAAEFGVDAHLVRISVGLENTNELCRMFRQALEAIDSRHI